jgi:hypothetical protein
MKTFQMRSVPKIRRVVLGPFFVVASILGTAKGGFTDMVLQTLDFRGICVCPLRDVLIRQKRGFTDTVYDSGLQRDLCVSLQTYSEYCSTRMRLSETGFSSVRFDAACKERIHHTS